MEAAIGRTGDVNGKINAICTLVADQAMSEARRVEKPRVQSFLDLTII